MVEGAKLTHVLLRLDIAAHDGHDEGLDPGGEGQAAEPPARVVHMQQVRPELAQVALEGAEGAKALPRRLGKRPGADLDSRIGKNGAERDQSHRVTQGRDGAASHQSVNSGAIAHHGDPERR
jgi:hypothetical protein